MLEKISELTHTQVQLGARRNTATATISEGYTSATVDDVQSTYSIQANTIAGSSLR